MRTQMLFCVHDAGICTSCFRKWPRHCSVFVTPSRQYLYLSLCLSFTSLSFSNLPLPNLPFLRPSCFVYSFFFIFCALFYVKVVVEKGPGTNEWMKIGGGYMSLYLAVAFLFSSHMDERWWRQWRITKYNECTSFWHSVFRTTLAQCACPLLALLARIGILRYIPFYSHSCWEGRSLCHPSLLSRVASSVRDTWFDVT